MKRVLPFLLRTLALLSPCIASGQTVVLDPAPFADENGCLTKEKGLIYTLHCNSQIHRDYDKDLSGELSQEEAAVLVKQENKKADDLIKIYQQNMVNFQVAEGPLPERIPPDLYRRAADITAPPETNAPKVFRMRGTVEDFATPVDNKTPLNKINPLLLSYSYNALNKGDQWAAKGAVGGYWENDKGFGAFSLGAEFERLSADEPGVEDIDVLVLKALASDRYVYQDNPLMNTLGWNFGTTYATDFEFDGGQLGLTAEISPLWQHPAFTSVWSLFGIREGVSASNYPALALRNSIHIEGGGTVATPGDRPLPDDKYLRIGPKIEGSFWPFGYHRPLRLFAGYGHYFEVLGSGPDYHNFTGGLEWQLDTQGHFVLNATYNHGRTAMTLEQRQALLISLGVRF